MSNFVVDYLLQNEGLHQLLRHPSRRHLKTQRLAKHRETRNRARQQRAKIEPQKDGKLWIYRKMLGEQIDGSILRLSTNLE